MAYRLFNDPSSGAENSMDQPPRAPRVRWTVSAVVFVVCSLFYFSNGKTLAFWAGYDSLPNRVIPFSLIRNHTLTLDPFRAEFEKGRPDKWYLRPRDRKSVV